MDNAHLPQAFAHLITDRLTVGVPRENLATCSNCSMCAPTRDRPATQTQSRLFFNPSTKCCTYHPDLPNYVVGGILQDATSSGAFGSNALREIIARRTGVFPTGISKPRKFKLLYDNSPDAFGKSVSMRCPLYIADSGGCSIWQYRNSVCTTWFCKHENGFEGLQYWRAVRDYLQYLEAVLVHYSLSQLGWPAADSFSSSPGDNFSLRASNSLRPLSASDLDDTPSDPIAFKKIWAGWAGRETEMYIKCFELIQELTSKHVAQLGGIKLDLLLKRVEERRMDLTNEDLPDTLIRNPALRCSITDDGKAVLTCYSSLDPVTTSQEVYEAIEQFDGYSSLNEINEYLQLHRGITMSKRLVRQLYARRVLIRRDELDLKTS